MFGGVAAGSIRASPPEQIEKSGCATRRTTPPHRAIFALDTTRERVRSSSGDSAMVVPQRGPHAREAVQIPSEADR